MSYGAKAMTCTCQIKWIDKHGNPTPDNNPAIGRCRTIARYQMIAGRNLFFDASEWFNICAEHARQLTDKGMHIWEFEPFQLEWRGITFHEDPCEQSPRSAEFRAWPKEDGGDQ
jgi:hypothetical protein